MAKATKVTEQQYRDALATVAAAETDTMQTVRETIETLQSTLRDARDQLNEVLGALPSVPGPVSPARSSLQGWTQQVASFESQSTYMLQALDSMLTQYGQGTLPADAPPATAPTA